MKSLRSLVKGNTESTAGYILFAVVSTYILYNGQPETVGLGAGVALILYVLTNGNILVSALLGALVALVALYYSRTPMVRVEGFEEEKEEKETEKEVKKEVKKDVKKLKNPPPDNGDRAEFLTLGKKYKLPNEADDEDYHLDAGTTFMNAYKSLKPDQIASMSKDTQELMATQKQLMGTLATLKPLINDGKQMMEMFKGYFGDGAQTN
jgi:hypothetical protein